MKCEWCDKNIPIAVEVFSTNSDYPIILHKNCYEELLENAGVDK